MDEAETRLDEVDTRLRGYETRLKCLEAPYRVVLRGFESVRAFLSTLDAGDFKGAKTVFIPSFIQELRDRTGPEVNQLVEELDTLLCERQGWVVLGVFPTGGMKEEMPDGLVRLQPGGVGNRVSTLCSQISLYLADSHQMFQDRVRRDKGRGGQRQGQGQGGWSQRRHREGKRGGQIECPAEASCLGSPSCLACCNCLFRGQFPSSFLYPCGILRNGNVSSGLLRAPFLLFSARRFFRCNSRRPPSHNNWQCPMPPWVIWTKGVQEGCDRLFIGPGDFVYIGFGMFIWSGFCNVFSTGVGRRFFKHGSSC